MTPNITDLIEALEQIANPQPTFAGPQCCQATFEDACELLSDIARQALAAQPQGEDAASELAALSATPAPSDWRPMQTARRTGKRFWRLSLAIGPRSPASFIGMIRNWSGRDALRTMSLS